jgi:hypothetical protein
MMIIFGECNDPFVALKETHAPLPDDRRRLPHRGAPPHIWEEWLPSKFHDRALPPIMCELIMSEVFDRFPKLKIVGVETEVRGDVRVRPRRRGLRDLRWQ